MLIDAVFRGGDKPPTTPTRPRTLSHLIQKIRRKYRSDVPIIVRLDSGFFDQKLLQVLETLEVGYIVAGKLYGDVQQYILQLEETAWGVSLNGDQEWHYVELGDRRGSWDKFRRGLFCRPAYENRQRLLPLPAPVRSCTPMVAAAPWTSSSGKRGCSVGFKRKPFCKAIRDRNRALKDFASQTLPFKRAPNAAYYYTLLETFFLYECFKEDVCQPVVPLNCYPTTLRRRIVDVAGKIVRHAGQILLKVTAPPGSCFSRPTLAKERPPAAFRLGLSQKTKASLLPHGPRVSASASAQGLFFLSGEKLPPCTL